MSPAEVAKLWEGASPAIFGAKTGPEWALARVCLFPMKTGGGYMVIVWRPDKSVIDDPVVDCIASGGRCKSTNPVGAAKEAVAMLLELYPPETP